MLQRLLDLIERTVLRRPRTVLGVAIALCGVAVWLGTGIEMRTSRRELTPEGDPNQARWDALRRDFSGPEPLIVAIEAHSPSVGVERLESIAGRLGARYADDPTVSRVFYRMDLDWLTDHALYLVAPETLEEVLQQIEDLLAQPDGDIRLGGFAALDERLAKRLERALGTGSGVPAPGAADGAARLAELMAQQRRFLEDPEAYVDEIGDSPLALLDTADRGSITANGYLATHGESTVFVLISLAGDDGNLALQQRLVASVRATMAAMLQDQPDVSYGLTGSPAMDVEEMAAIRRDGRRTSLIATAGVFLLSLLAFQIRRHALVGLLTLGTGVLWSIGAVRLELGYLNMITTALIPILVGMGIDYAVHPISQYELERHSKQRSEAVRAAIRKTGGAVVISALTTAAAFFCFLFMQFRGFSELGLVTGFGVLLCLAAALIVLPALLVLHGAWYDPEGAPRKAAVDRLWDENVARALTRRPRSIVIAGIAITVAAAPLATGVTVRKNLLELLPASAESLRYLHVLNDESALSSDFNLVTADSLEQLQSMQQRAAGRPEIARFESILTFLPARPERSRAAVARAAGLLQRLRLEPAPDFDPEALEQALARLVQALEEAADSAFVAGYGQLSGALEQARGDAVAARTLVLGGDAAREAAWSRGEAGLRVKLQSVLERLRVAARSDVPTLASMPRAIANRFVTPAGRYIAYLHPSGDMYDASFLPRFNRVCRDISADAIGFPILFQDHSNVITSGFGLALGAGAVLVFLLLWLDLRDPRHTLLALAPVVTGTIWMLGLMRLLDLSFNFANLVAVPIVLGVGIDAGVHMVHRYRLERDAGIVTVVAHTGRAILVASLTTMVGFGSLGLASHRGMASLGILLLLGVGASTSAALVLLPNLLVVLGLARR